MADLSPEIAAQLQALESSYGENPGRYFVPYAGLLREARQPERAEEILRENLKRFPGLSAHVLLGRCLADRGAYQEASNEFHYVLSIDAQNLIALRTLAEMSAASGRTAEARRWYDELLAVDPMNGDARAAVARLGTGDADASTADQPASAASGWGGAGEPAAASPVPAAEDGAQEEETDAGWGNLELDAAPAPAAHDEPPAPEFDAFGFGEVELDGEADEPGDARIDLGEETAPPESGDDEFGLLDFGEEAEEEEEAAASVPADEASGEPEVVTETMAELYASQGLREQAAEVYRELIQWRGEEPALLRRLAELEAAEEEGVEAEEVEEPARDEAPDWLLRVDAAVDQGDEHDRLPDLGLDTSLGELELEAPAPAAAAPEPAGATTGDSFAESVSAGFADEDGTGEPEPEERAAWSAPEVEEAGTEAAGGFDLVVIDEAVELDGDAHPPESAEEAAELSADWAVAAAPLEEQEEQEEEPAPAAGAAEPAPAGTRRTMRDYFATLLSWTPAPAEAVPAEEEVQAAAPATAEPAPGDVAPAAGEEPEEPLPWELPADAPAHEDAAPAAPSTAGEGFSFEEFFAGGAGPEPEPAQPEAGADAAPAAPPPAPGGTEGAGGQPAAGEGDEDLESFQAWLQSLKR